MTRRSRVKPVSPSVARKAILYHMEHNLRMVEQWSEMRDFARAAYYAAKAEALIEVLEVDDCRSMGGFDAERGQPRPSPINPLRARYEWLRGLPVSGNEPRPPQTRTP